MNRLVKLLVNEDGDTVENPVWCLVDPSEKQAPMPLCDGAVFESWDAVYVQFESKRVQRGGITCQKCLERLNILNAVRL